MRGAIRNDRVGLWLVAMVVATGALLGVWHGRKAPSTPEPVHSLRASFQQPPLQQAQAEEIEQALARAGCPGWMVLASEGPQALGPEVVPTEFRTPATTVPTVQYPVTLRVASRPQPPQQKLQAVETPSDPDNPDDLLDGASDLLWNQPPSPEESQTDSSTDEDQPEAGLEEQPAEEAPVEPDPLPEAVGGAQQSETPAPDAPQLPPEPTAEPEPVKTTEDGSEALRHLPPLEESQPPIPIPPQEEPLHELPTVEEPRQPEPRFPQESPANDEDVPTPKEESPRKAPFRIEDLPAAQPEEIEEPKPAPATKPNDTQSFSDLFAAPSAPPPSRAPHSVSSNPATSKTDKKPQCEFVADSLYPSAFACATCHEKIFDEWRVSSHGYAAISPMFQKFEQTISNLSQGTIGYFCYRCHSPAGVSLGISRDTPLWNMPQVAREGVTCVACHRVDTRYGKVNGERRIEPGDVFAPVYGSIGGSGVAEAIARKSELKVKTSPHEKGPGQDMHVAGVCFDQLSKPDFCVSCHQVAVHPGIKLEVVWEQYRASPACKKGISCQDCHMGRIPGVPSGYEIGSAALVNKKSVNVHRKHANHIFYGPGYSIAHPGVFPHNKDALRWSMQDWLLFDYRAGWGTEEFEKAVENGVIGAQFPPVWAEADDRLDAREIINDNQKKLNEKRISRIQVMENGSHVDGPFFQTPLVRGQDMRFHYIVTNTNEGHNMPSGSLGAQPQLWANVVLIGPRGQRLWESGYTDRWGDLADIHSEEVRNKRLAYDWQLFNLQSMFLITGAKGTDREFFLPVNVDIDQLPYLRPGAQPISVINHPPFIRMEGRSLAPLGSRKAPYKIPGELLREPGCYRLSFRMRMRTQPIYFMRFCNATIEMQRAMNEDITDFHQSSFEFVVQ